MAPSIAEAPCEGTQGTQTYSYYNKLQTSATSKDTLEDAIRGRQLVPLWNTGGPPTGAEPSSKHVPAVWKYDDTKSLLLRAAELVDAREAERRAVLMINPGPQRPPFTLDMLLAAHQLILPGEKAVCHRHSPFAVRFLIEGTKGYTAISGKKMYMTPGDLIITPVWNWHDHGNEGTDNVIWMDGLNIPLFKHVPVDFTEHYLEEYGVDTHASQTATDGEAADMKFAWTAMQARLDAPGGDFASLEYLRPNGQSVSTTIGAYAHRIAAGKAAPAVQETAGNIFQVHAGAGHTDVVAADGTARTLAWARGDCFVVPPWSRFQHVADAGADAYLFNFSDKPMQVNLGFWRAKAV